MPHNRGFQTSAGFLYMLALSLVCQGLPAQTNSVVQSETPAKIYVARRGWHVDIGFAAADLRAPLDLLVKEFPGARYIFIGFGDERYLLAKKHTGPVLLGALWPGKGMLLITALKGLPQEAFGATHVATLAATAAQMRSAQAYVGGSFAMGAADDHGDIKSYAVGPYEGSLYYSATPTYSALHTCNTWVAEVLSAAGFRLRGGGVIFAGQIWSRVQQLQKKQLAIAGQTANAFNAGYLGPSQQGGLVPSWQTTTVPEF